MILLGPWCESLSLSLSRSGGLVSFLFLSLLFPLPSSLYREGRYDLFSLMILVFRLSI